MSIFRKLFLLITATTVLMSCTGVFFQPSRELYPADYLETIKHKDIFFFSSDGTRLHGLLLEPEAEPEGLILHLHGNAENLRTHTRGVLFLVRAGYRVFVFDYRGYGLSEGKPDIDGVHKDAEAALKVSVRYSPDGKVIVLGQSLGGAIAVYLAANAPLRGRIKSLIVDSAFSSYRKITEEKLGTFFLTAPLKHPLSLLVSDRYSPEKYVAEIGSPVLFIHGLADMVVPPGHSFYLYKKAPEPKMLWFVYGTGHIEALHQPQLQKRLLRYLQNLR